jgi:23S rRNA pseudouridine1911/1915/1917 synthase
MKQIVELSDGGQRLDVYLAKAYPYISRSHIKKLCDSGRVYINGQAAKASDKLKEHNNISIDDELLRTNEVPKIKLPIIYEDDDCVVINKPAGLLSHSKGEFNPEATVASWLNSKLTYESTDSRAGIVHRLDRGTSGVMICAKTELALKWLQKQFSTRKVKKTYIALSKGHFKPSSAIIDMPIERNPKAPATFRVGVNGKKSVTRYHVVASSDHLDKVELMPETGRTHQLRVHLAKLNHPILGDQLYGGDSADRLYLHANSLSLRLPNGDLQTFTAKLPAEFNRVIKDDQ